MAGRAKFDLISAAAFVTAEIILGYLLQVSPSPDHTYDKFASVLLALLFSLIQFRFRFESLFVVIGLLFTVFADWYLVMCDPMMQLEGMVFFCFTQTCYGALLFVRHRKRSSFISHFLVRTVSCLIAITATVAVLGDGADALSIVSMFYYANLILNVIIALIQIRRSVIFPIALLLFLACDTVIGLSVMASSYLDNAVVSAILAAIRSMKFDVAWAFYLPSQMLIPLAMMEMCKKENKKIISNID